MPEQLPPHVWAAKRECNRHILSYYSDIKQRNAALGIGFTPEQTAKMVNFIERVIARCDEYEANDKADINYDDITP